MIIMAHGPTQISAKREKHREQNRIAARRCSIKKKQEHQQIQNTLHGETARYDSLIAEINTLHEEIWTLRRLVFAHTGCNDQRIRVSSSTVTILSSGSSTYETNVVIKPNKFFFRSKILNIISRVGKTDIVRRLGQAAIDVGNE
jgi:hypothetical protein